jgi:hypothetical protein
LTQKHKCYKIRLYKRARYTSKLDTLTFLIEGRRNDRHSDSLSHDYSRLSSDVQITANSKADFISRAVSRAPVQLYKQGHPSASKPRFPSSSAMDADTFAKKERKLLRDRRIEIHLRNSPPALVGGGKPPPSSFHSCAQQLSSACLCPSIIIHCHVGGLPAISPRPMLWWPYFLLRPSLRSSFRSRNAWASSSGYTLREELDQSITYKSSMAQLEDHGALSSSYRRSKQGNSCLFRRRCDNIGTFF